MVTLQMFTLGVVNSKKFALGNRFSTFSVPKEIDQPRIFCLASIWSCTVASKLEALESTLLIKKLLKTKIPPKEFVISIPVF